MELLAVVVVSREVGFRCVRLGNFACQVVAKPNDRTVTSVRVSSPEIR